MSKIIILGAGNALDDIVEILNLSNIHNFKIFDDDKKKTHPKYKIHGNFLDAVERFKGKSKFIFCFGTAKTTQSRETLYNKFNFQPKDLINVIHPNSSISKLAKLGNGVIVKSNAVIMPNARIGNNVIISQLVSVSHHVKVGSHSILAPSSSLSGGSVIQKSCFIGSNASVNENITIGKCSIIGIGAVVKNKLPTYSILK